MVRWRQRKNKQGGALMKRPCTCGKKKASLCVAHRMDKVLVNKKIGEKIFNHTAHQLLVKLRHYLGLLSVKNGQACRFKSVRSGKATCMAAKGYSTPNIMAAGGWNSSKSLTPYVDASAADEMEQLRKAMGPSDEE